MLYRTVIVAETERALVVAKGITTRWLEPGVHRLWWADSRTRVVSIDLDLGWIHSTPELRRLVPSGAAEAVDVAEGQLGLVSVDGLPCACLEPGRYLLWQLRAEVRTELRDTRQLVSEIGPAWEGLVPSGLLRKVVVAPYQRALVYADGALAQVLEEGAYLLNARERIIAVVVVELREQELQISGQEVMTADKVSLRTNLIVKYRIVDAVAAVQSVGNLRDALYSEAQLCARRMVAGLGVDQLLERRNEAAASMRTELATRASDWGVEVLALDLKDVVLPGEMKTILNQVIEAQKRAAANAITRREETAATRSLANTARLMEANPMLMRLRQLEALEGMAEKVGSITVVAGGEELMGKLSLMQ